MYAPAGDVTHFGQAIEPFNVPRMWSDVMVRADVRYACVKVSDEAINVIAIAQYSKEACSESTTTHKIFVRASEIFFIMFHDGKHTVSQPPIIF